MNSYLRKTLVMLPALPILGTGASFFLIAGQGTDPFTSFQQGISLRTGLSVGTASLLMNILILVFFFFYKRKLIGLGAIICTFGIGPCIDLSSSILHQLFPGPQPPYMIVLFMVAGLIFKVVGLSYYLPVGAGIQPLDMVATELGHLVKKSYGVGLTIFYLILLLGAFLLGAPIGIGTIIAAVLVGKLVDWFSPLIGRLSSRLAGNTPPDSTARA